MDQSAVRAIVLIGLCVVGLVSPSGAQPTRPASRPPNSLVEMVPEISWDPARRGPLIIVAPEKARINALQPQALPRGSEGYTVNALAPYFDFRLISCGTTAVFAPATMRVIAGRLSSPNIIGAMTRGDRLALLKKTFTRRQWQQIASEQGLGTNDLTGRQRDLFLSILPEPMTIRRTTADESGMVTTQMQTLTGAQRASARISLRKRITWGFPVGKEGNGIVQAGINVRVPNSELLEILPISGEAAPFAGYDVPQIYGVPLIEKQRTRLKPGDLPLDWKGLDPVISLEGAKNVGELIERVRQATRVELYCDRRYAELPVALWGTSARSGDVLTALCYGVTGTFRKVGSAFVMTDDREGLGTRLGRILEWAETTKAAAFTLPKEIGSVGEARPASFALPWDTADPASADTGLTGKVAAFQKRREAPRTGQQNNPENPYLEVAIAELPAAARFQAEKQADIVKKMRLPVRGEVRADAVLLSSYDVSMLVIPGVGAAQMQELAGRRINIDPPEGNLPGPLADGGSAELEVADRTLIVSPRTPDEAGTAVREAKKRGFTQLWIAIRPEDIAIVQAAVKAGKTVGIPVGAVVRVLRAGANTTLSRDVNLLGEDSNTYVSRLATHPEILFAGTTNHSSTTQKMVEPLAQQLREREERWGAWLRCDTPQVQATVLGRIAAVAKTPGLAGLVLRDLHAPGFAPITQRYGSAAAPRFVGSLGYSEDLRLAFLRQHGVDPVDLGPGPLIEAGSVAALVNLTYMPDYGLAGKYTSLPATTYDGRNPFEVGARDTAEKWIEFRATIGNRFAEALLRGVRAAAPGIPLWIYPQQDDLPFGGVRWLTRLDEGDAGIRLVTPAPEPLQPWPPVEGDIPTEPLQTVTTYQRALQGAKAASFSIWMPYAAVGSQQLTPIQIDFLWADRAKEGWTSLTYDLSDHPMEAIPGLLNGITFVNPR